LIDNTRRMCVRDIDSIAADTEPFIGGPAVVMAAYAGVMSTGGNIMKSSIRNWNISVTDAEDATKLCRRNPNTHPITWPRIIMYDQCNLTKLKYHDYQ